MSRSPIQVRDAVPDDAAALIALWADLFLRTASDHGSAPSEDEARLSIARFAAEVDRRLLVADVDGSVAGAALLTRAPMTPLHADDAIQVSHLMVAPERRRHGVGRALLEGAVGWAEEKGTPSLLAAAAPHDRDANRFLARLGFVQVGMVRAAPVSLLRAKLLGNGSHRSVGQVLARRRSQRRAQARML